MNTKIEQKPKATRDGFGDGLVIAAETNSSIVGVSADLTESTRMNKFADAYPDRFIRVGVAEQNLAGVSSGLALTGKKVFAASYAVFSPGRNWDQIRVSICYANRDVVIVGGHTGFSASQDGATHQALEDIAMMRVLPKMTVISPADYEEARQATIYLASQHKGPAYLRLSKENTEALFLPKYNFEFGKAVFIRRGNDLTLVSTGSMTQTCHSILETMGTDSNVEHIHIHTIKPLDIESIRDSVLKTRQLLVVEEHQVAGGLGSAILEGLSENPVPTKLIGVNDKFGESGSATELKEKYGLGRKTILQSIQEMVLKKKHFTS